ncbi:MAG: VTT domain-containing protein [Reichenbachiella sp.]
MFLKTLVLLYNQNKSIAIVMVWLVVMPVLSTAISAYFLYSNESIIHEFTTLHWVMFYGVTIVTMSLAITPTTYVAMVSGYFLGWDAVFPVVGCYLAASGLGFIGSQKLDHGFRMQLMDQFPKSKTYFSNLGEKQFVTTILSRLSPALPFAMMNVVLCLAGIRLRTFITAGFVGMLPRTLFFIWVGAQAQNMQSALNSSSNFGWSIAITVAMLFVIYKLIKPKA